MEAKHWFGAVGLGAALIAVSFAFNQYQKPGDTPGARPFVADLGDAGAVAAAPIYDPTPTIPVPMPTLGIKAAGGSKPKPSTGGGAGQPAGLRL